MANHLEEQKSPHTCKLLVVELERIINEEIEQRNKLFKAGVRDVAKYIDLPVNKVDQLDEESANYDDKRLCHECKHVCFFSCVACECSKSKVSCLRHSHFMCRCPTEKRYMMVWSSEREMKETIVKTKAHLKKLESKYIDLTGDDDDNDHEIRDAVKGNVVLADAPGAAVDAKRHKGYYVDVSASSKLFQVPSTGQRLSSHANVGTIPYSSAYSSKYPMKVKQPKGL
jgi:histone demethylase JARID1